MLVKSRILLLLYTTIYNFNQVYGNTPRTQIEVISNKAPVHFVKTPHSKPINPIKKFINFVNQVQMILDDFVQEENSKPIVIIKENLPILSSSNKHKEYTAEEMVYYQNEVEKKRTQLLEFELNISKQYDTKKNKTWAVIDLINNEIAEFQDNFNNITSNMDKRAFAKVFGIFIAITAITGTGVAMSGKKVMNDFIANQKPYINVARLSSAAEAMKQELCQFITEKHLDPNVLSKYKQNDEYIDISNTKLDACHREFRKEFRQFLENAYSYFKDGPKEKKQEFISNLFLLAHNFQSIYAITKKYDSIADLTSQHNSIIDYLGGLEDSLNIIDNIISEDILDHKTQESLVNVLCFFSHHSNTLIKQILKKNVLHNVKKEIRNLINRRIQRFQEQGKIYFLNYEKNTNSIDAYYTTTEELNIFSLLDEEFIYNTSGWMNEVAHDIASSVHPMAAKFVDSALKLQKNMNFLIEVVVKPSLFYDREITRETKKFNDKMQDNYELAKDKLDTVIKRLQKKKKQFILKKIFNTWSNNEDNKSFYKNGEKIKLPFIKDVKDHYAAIKQKQDRKKWHTASDKLNDFIQNVISLLESKGLSSDAKEFIFVIYNLVGRVYEIPDDQIKNIIGNFSTLFTIMKDKRITRLLGQLIELLDILKVDEIINKIGSTNKNIDKIQNILEVLRNLYKVTLNGVNPDIINSFSEKYYSLVTKDQVIKHSSEDEQNIRKSVSNILNTYYTIVNDPNINSANVFQTIKMEIQNKNPEDNILYQVLYLVFYKSYICNQEYGDLLQYNIHIDKYPNIVHPKLIKVQELSMEITKIVKMLLNFFQESEIQETLNNFLDNILKLVIDLVIEFNRNPNLDIQDSLKNRFAIALMQNIIDILNIVTNSDFNRQKSLISDFNKGFTMFKNDGKIDKATVISKHLLQYLVLPFLEEQMHNYKILETIPSTLNESAAIDENFKILYDEFRNFIPFFENINQETFIKIIHDIRLLTKNFFTELETLKNDRPHDQYSVIIIRYFKILVGRSIAKNIDIIMQDLEAFVIKQSQDASISQGVNIQETIKNTVAQQQVQNAILSFFRSFLNNISVALIHLSSNQYQSESSILLCLDSLQETLHTDKGNLFRILIDNINQALGNIYGFYPLNGINFDFITEKIIDALKNEIYNNHKKLNFQIIIHVIVNVLMNNLKFIPPNGGTIEMHQDTEGNLLATITEDNGKKNTVYVSNKIQKALNEIALSKEEVQKDQKKQRQVVDMLIEGTQETIKSNGGPLNMIATLAEDQKTKDKYQIFSGAVKVTEKAIPLFIGKKSNTKKIQETINKIQDKTIKIFYTNLVNQYFHRDIKKILKDTMELKDIFKNKELIEQIIYAMLQGLISIEDIPKVIEEIQNLIKEKQDNNEVIAMGAEVLEQNKNEIKELAVEGKSYISTTLESVEAIFQLADLVPKGTMVNIISFIRKNSENFLKLIQCYFDKKLTIEEKNQQITKIIENLESFSVVILMDFICFAYLVSKIHHKRKLLMAKSEEQGFISEAIEELQKDKILATLSKAHHNITTNKEKLNSQISFETTLANITVIMFCISDILDSNNKLKELMRDKEEFSERLSELDRCFIDEKERNAAIVKIIHLNIQEIVSKNISQLMLISQVFLFPMIKEILGILIQEIVSKNISQLMLISQVFLFPMIKEILGILTPPKSFLQNTYLALTPCVEDFVFSLMDRQIYPIIEDLIQIIGQNPNVTNTTELLQIILEFFQQNQERIKNIPTEGKTILKEKLSSDKKELVGNIKKAVAPVMQGMSEMYSTLSGVASDAMIVTKKLANATTSLVCNISNTVAQDSKAVIQKVGKVYSETMNKVKEKVASYSKKQFILGGSVGVATLLPFSYWYWKYLSYNEAKEITKLTKEIKLKTDTLNKEKIELIEKTTELNRQLYDLYQVNEEKHKQDHQKQLEEHNTTIMDLHNQITNQTKTIDLLPQQIENFNKQEQERITVAHQDPSNEQNYTVVQESHINQNIPESNNQIREVESIPEIYDKDSDPTNTCIREKHQQEIEATNKLHRQEIENLTKEYKESIAKLETEIQHREQAMKELVDQVNISHQQVDNLRKDLQNAKKENELKISINNERHRQEIENLTKEHKESIAKLETEIQTRERAMKELADQVNISHQQVDNLRRDLQNTTAQNELKISVNNALHRQEIENLTKKHKESIAELKTEIQDREQAINDLADQVNISHQQISINNELHRQEIENLTKEHKESIAKLEIEIQKRERAMKELVDQMNDSEEKHQQDHQKQLEEHNTTIMDLHNQITNQTETIDLLQQQIENFNKQEQERIIVAHQDPSNEQNYTAVQESHINQNVPESNNQMMEVENIPEVCDQEPNHTNICIREIHQNNETQLEQIPEEEIYELPDDLPPLRNGYSPYLPYPYDLQELPNDCTTCIKKDESKDSNFISNSVYPLASSLALSIKNEATNNSNFKKTAALFALGFMAKSTLHTNLFSYAALPDYSNNTSLYAVSGEYNNPHNAYENDVVEYTYAQEIKDQHTIQNEDCKSCLTSTNSVLNRPVIFETSGQTLDLSPKIVWESKPFVWETANYPNQEFHLPMALENSVLSNPNIVSESTVNNNATSIEVDNNSNAIDPEPIQLIAVIVENPTNTYIRETTVPESNNPMMEVENIPEICDKNSDPTNTCMREIHQNNETQLEQISEEELYELPNEDCKSCLTSTNSVLNRPVIFETSGQTLDLSPKIAWERKSFVWRTANNPNQEFHLPMALENSVLSNPNIASESTVNNNTTSIEVDNNSNAIDPEPIQPIAVIVENPVINTQNSSIASKLFNSFKNNKIYNYAKNWWSKKK